MTSIFLSHSSKDNTLAEALRERLQQRGHMVFLDFDPESGIKGGGDWEKTLYERLRVCRVVIPLLTPNWIASKWCFAEVVHARSNGKTIVPLKVADCDVSSVFPDVQQINLTGNQEEGYRRLDIALKEVFPWDPQRPPYPGLPTFQEADAAIFFGRTPEIATGIETLESLRRRGSAAPRFALVLGASGSGKSSLVRAGILPRLRARPGWLPIPPLRPGVNPLDELATSLAQAYEQVKRPRDYTEIRDRLEEALLGNSHDDNALIDITRDLAIKSQSSDKTVLIVIDQAEELFGESIAQQADRFLRLLRRSLERAEGRLMALATMRSEFLGAFQTHPFLLDPTYQEPFAYEKITIDPVPVDRFTEIIRGPAELAGIVIADDLVERMAADTGTRDALPLLAYTLRRLWDSEAYRADGRFELDEYAALGGLEGSIRNAADEALGAGELPPSQLEALRATFVPALVRVGADGARVRRRAYRDELPRAADKSIQRFIDARLLVTDLDRDGRETIELAHEALLRVWPQLDGWLEQDQDKLRLLEGVLSAAEEWQHGERGPYLLVHRGDRLADALTLVREPRFTLKSGTAESDYLAACETAQQAQEEAEREERERRIRDAERIAAGQRKVARRTLAGLLAALVLAIGSSVAGWMAWINAEEAEQRMLEANLHLAKVYEQKTVTALDHAKSSHNTKAYQTALLYALAALGLKIEPGQKALELTTAVEFLDPLVGRQAFAQRWASPALSNPVLSIAFSPDGATLATSLSDKTVRLWEVPSGRLMHTLEGHGRRVDSVTFSPDGETLATGSRDGAVRLWELPSGKVIYTLEGHRGRVRSVAFSPDGKVLVSAALEDKTVRLWDAASGALMHSLPPQSRGVKSVAFSPDGKMLATGSDHDPVQLWDVANGEPSRILSRLPSYDATSFAFSPDGKTLARGSKDKNVRLWDVASGRDIRRFEGHSRNVTNIAFSPDGETLATSAGGTVRLWDVASAQLLRTLEGHGKAVAPFAFSPDGKILATGSRFRTACLWDVTSGAPLGTTLESHGHGGTVVSVAFSPDGKFLVSGSEDMSLRLWDVVSGEFVPKLKGVTSVAFSPDGKTLAIVMGDTAVRLWDMVSGEPERILDGHDGAVVSIAFSPDGEILASGSTDKTVRLWEVPGGALVHTLEGHGGRVDSVTFSPDGQTLASDSADKTVRLWEVASGKPVRTLEGQGETVASFAFSSDGQTLATTTRTRSGAVSGVQVWDLTVRVWDLVTGEVVRTFAVDRIVSLAFSPEGKILATVSKDATVRLWDVLSGESVHTLEGHKQAVVSVAFSPDGKTLAAGSSDRTIRLWDVASGGSVGTLEGHRGRVASLAFSPNGKTLASGSTDMTVRLWDVADNPPTRILGRDEDQVFYVDLSPDGQTLASVSEDKTVLRLWDVVSGEPVRTLMDHADAIVDVDFSADGRTLASLSADKTVRLWEVASGEIISTFEVNGERVSSIDLNSDGKILASCSRDGTLRLWEVVTGKLLHILKGSVDVAFSPDGEMLATHSSDSKVSLWKVANGEHIRNFQAHRNTVTKLVFSPDSKTLASGSKDHSVRLWDSVTGKLLHTLVPPGSGDRRYIIDVAFSPDGKILVTSYLDRTLRLWEVATGRLLDTLTAHDRRTYYDVSFSPDGKILVATSADGHPPWHLLLWDLRLLAWLTNEPSPELVLLGDAIGFLWRLQVEGRKVQDLPRTPSFSLYQGQHFIYDPRFAPLLKPPVPGLTKFDQVMDWVEQQAELTRASVSR